MRKLRSKQGAAIAAAAIIGAGAGGAAIAASGSGSPFSPSAFLDDLAGRLGVTTQKLKDASKAAALDQVDAALKAGTITQAQADELKARINAGDGVPFLGGPGFGFHHLGGPHGVGDQLDAAATYLGLTEQALRQKLESGQTLAQITQATSGKTVDGLKQAIVDAATKQLDQAVADKRITAAQEQTILADLKSRLDGLVNGTLPTHRFGPDRFSGGPGGPLFRGSRQA